MFIRRSVAPLKKVGRRNVYEDSALFGLKASRRITVTTLRLRCTVVGGLDLTFHIAIDSTWIANYSFFNGPNLD